MGNLTGLTELTTFTGDEQFYVVEDDDGTPVPRRITIESLAAGLAARAELSGAYAPLDLAGIGNKSGYYFTPKSSGTTTGAPTADRANYVAVVVADSLTLDRIGIEVTTLAASSVIRLGIYANDDGLPGALILDAGTVDSTSTGIKEITISQALTPGVYWLAAASQGGAPAVRLGQGATVGSYGHATASVASANVECCYQEAGVTGALPATATVSITQVTHPRVLVRVA